ncbi:MAG: hypothetical protein HY010_16715 [Acidobacteria bacterium]|nr:hypothetical protein [Acidobacteriota bacterium]
MFPAYRSQVLETLANSFVYTLAAYAGLGLLFAIRFVWRGVQRVDSEAQGAGLGFRLLILSGVAALWPMFLYRLARGVEEPPGERNPHRTTS